MRISLLQVKVVHTLIFFVLSACVVYVLVSGVSNRITYWSWVAVAAVLVEGIVLAVSGWTCPLTKLAERAGAADGSVADIFLPKWLADRIFPICGTTFAVGCAALVYRLLLG